MPPTKNANVAKKPAASGTKPDGAKPSSNGPSAKKPTSATSSDTARLIAAPPPPKPLWPIKCAVIGVTGRIHTGKTLFGYGVSPQEGTTLVYDFERGGESYTQAYAGHTIVDVARAMDEAEVDPYHAPNLWAWWFNDVQERLATGKYRVVFLDTIVELESSLEAWVRRNPKHFQRTENQYAKMGMMAIVPDMKAMWKRVLTALSAKVQTLVFSTHMKPVYANKKPTGIWTPKGKDVLAELAALYLELSRPVINGERKRIPNAKLLKDRLGHFVPHPTTGEPMPVAVLPSTIEDCTPARIRWYMKHPFGLSGEKDLVQAETLSDDDRLLLRAGIADAELEAAELKSENLERAERLADARARIKAANEAEEEPSAEAEPEDETPEEEEATPEAEAEVEAEPEEEEEEAQEEAEFEDVDAEAPEEEEEEPADEFNPDDAATPDEVKTLNRLKKEIFAKGMTPAEWAKVIAKRGGKAGDPKTLNRGQIKELIHAIASKLDMLELHDALYGSD